MDGVLLLDAARAAHLIGLALGLGLAFCADLLALRALSTPIAERDVWLLRSLHRVILGGLLLLWISGLYILYLRTGFDPAKFSPKLMAKLVVVTLLSLNALSISLHAIPGFAAQTGRTFGAFPPALRLRLALIAGLSASCWLTALALGAFSQLKPMGFDALFNTLSPLFALGLGGALLLSLLSGVMSRARGDADDERFSTLSQRA